MPEFEPHDVRETATRLRLPAARQRWMEHEGKTINSADLEKRGQPPYLLIMDLAFAASFSAIANILQEPDAVAGGVPAFFALYLPVVWVWNHVNTRLNVADAEDLSFELSVMGMSLLALLMSYQLPRCFVDDGRGTACLQVVSLYGGARAVMLCLTLWISVFVEGMRLMLWFDLLAALGWGLAIGLGLWRIIMREHGFDIVVVMLPCVFVWDVALLCAMIYFRRNAGGMRLAKLLPKTHLPMSIPYTEARMERMVTVVIGATIQNSLANAREHQDLLSVMTVGAYVVVSSGTLADLGLEPSTNPRRLTSRGVSVHLLRAFAPHIGTVLVKITYFDLSVGGRTSAEVHLHALRLSYKRGVAWTLTHLLLFGTILWLGTAVMQKTSVDDDVDAEATRCGRAFNLSAAFVAYLACVTLLHLLHKGGHGHRRLSKPRRVALRCVLMAALFVLPAFSCSGLAENDVPICTLALLMLTLQTAIELWGRGRSTPLASDEGEGEAGDGRAAREEEARGSERERPLGHGSLCAETFGGELSKEKRPSGRGGERAGVQLSTFSGKSHITSATESGKSGHEPSLRGTAGSIQEVPRL